MIVPTHRKGEQIMWLKSLHEKIQAWQRYRQSVWSLSRLSDRELAGVGIKRIDITYLASRATIAG